jgi:hypothetical protein
MAGLIEKGFIDDYVMDAYGTRDFEILGAAEILWSGWEGDTDAVLMRFADGRLGWAAVQGVTVAADKVTETLRERLTAYREAIRETEALLALAGEKM